MPKRVLIVDDEELVRISLKRALDKNADEVRCAASAEEALAALEASPFQLCFLDVRLPGMDGLECLTEIRRRFPDTRVAIVTASHLDEAQTALVAREAYELLPKPFDLSRVRAVVREVLGP
ncbi:MAG: response regulator [Deferrisomatales bacterium]|nr:response regulator [Deferrisomatales bacterium]